MIKKINLIAIILVIFTLFCCNHNRVETIIDAYSKTNFDHFRNWSIQLRSGGNSFNTSIYAVSYSAFSEDSCDVPYIVEYDRDKKQVIEVDNSLVIDRCKKKSLSMKEIYDIFTFYSKIDNISSITVDGKGNVFISNLNNSKDVVLLRKGNSVSSDSLLNMYPNYKQYKNNWFIKR
jgi:hypothetical protein